jgi:general stress protein 26
MNQEFIKKAESLISERTGKNFAPEKDPYCVLVLLDESGYPTGSTLTAADTKGIKELYFSTGLSSRKVGRIHQSNRASVCFSGMDYNITLVGTIEICVDAQLKKDMWYDPLSKHFSGPEDPEYCVLKFTTERYSFLIDWQEVQGMIE